MNIDSMIQGNPQALVTSYNGVLVADSLEVADRFGKAHKNVVRDIENLMDGIEANRLNFEPIAEKEYFIPDFYTDKRNREQKRYKLTRDGFSLPVYGDFENEEENHVYGSDVKAYGICGDYPKDVRLSEVKRAAEEAIAYDPWITSVDSVSVEEGEDKNGTPCFIVDIEFTDIFRNSILVEGVEV